MEIKCNRKVFNLTDKDVILFNGACYMLLTQTYRSNYTNINPTIAKAKAQKMIKDGILEMYNSNGMMKYYRLAV
jgi:hypothetical protein